MGQKDISKIHSYLSSLRESSRPLAIFDLDSTLYNVSPRTQKIVHDFCLSDEVKQLYPKESSILTDISIGSSDWGYFEALDRHNFISSVRFLKSLSKFWRQNFFSNTYMDHDETYKNASTFVNSFAPLDCEVMYLTGRSQNKMLAGSLKNLKRDSFPLQNENSLVMKTNPDLSDHIFKTDFIAEIKKNYEHIILFENEPKILNRVHVDHPEVMLCFIDSTHSRTETIKNSLPTINMDYTPLLGFADASLTP